MRGKESYVLRGCPYKAIPHSVILFHADMDDMEKGLLAPHRHDEQPARFAEMKDIYTIWAGFWRKRAAARDNPAESAPGLADIEALRASERRE